MKYELTKDLCRSSRLPLGVHLDYSYPYPCPPLYEVLDQVQAHQNLFLEHKGVKNLEIYHDTSCC